VSHPELTTQEKKRLLEALRDLQAGPKERRRDPRRPVQMSLCIRKIKSGKLQQGAAAPSGKRPLRAVSEVDLFSATLVNVSAHGVALVSKKSLAAGDKLLLPLRFREGGGWLVLCEVRNTSPQPNGRHRSGARFLDRIEDPDENAKIPMDWIL
jgi:hypothetical protein